MERYRVVNGSESGSDFFTHTVYDSYTPLEKQGYFKIICECTDVQTAEDIAQALNEKGW
jgi:hypothetical protein